MPRKKTPQKVAKPRRPRGTGSSYQDPDRGGWEGKVPVGKAPNGTHAKTGKPKYKTLYRYFHADTRAEVERLMKGAAPAGPSVTVEEWCDRWLAAKKVRTGSRSAYKARIGERIKPTLGSIQVAKLTAFDVEEAIAKWKGKPATIRSTLSTLSTIMRAAMRAKLITENPVGLAPRPKSEKRKFDLFTREELKQIVDAGLTKPEWTTFAVLALTGMRIGECLSVLPTDFDAAMLRLSIGKTWTRAGIQDEPKSELSRRVIDVHEMLRDVLTTGVPNTHYQTAQRRWTAILKSLGIRRRGVHQLRHSFASYALADGASVADLAAHLGHTPEELLRTYAHPAKADMRQVAAKVVGL